MPELNGVPLYDEYGELSRAASIARMGEAAANAALAFKHLGDVYRQIIERDLAGLDEHQLAIYKTLTDKSNGRLGRGHFEAMRFIKS